MFFDHNGIKLEISEGNLGNYITHFWITLWVKKNSKEKLESISYGWKWKQNISEFVGSYQAVLRGKLITLNIRIGKEEKFQITVLRLQFKIKKKAN